MSEELVIDVKLNDSDFVSAVQSAADKIKPLQKGQDDLGSSAKELASIQSLLSKAYASTQSPMDRVNALLAQVNSITHKSITSTAKYQDTVAGLSAKLEDLRKKNANLAAKQEIDRLKEPYEKARKYYDSLETATGALGLPFSGVFAKLRDYNSAMGDNIEATDGAGISSMKWGMALGGVAAVGAAAAAAVVAGVVAGGVAIIAAVRSAEELNKQLAGFSKVQGFEPISAASIKSIQSAVASMDAIGTIFKRISVQVGTQFAPELKKATTYIVALGLGAMDFFDSFDSGGEMLNSLAKWLTSGFIKALAMPVTAIMKLESALGTLARAVGLDDLADQFDAAKAQYDDFIDDLASNTVDFWGGVAENTANTLVPKSLMDRARELIEIQKKVNEKAKEGAKSTADVAKAIEEQVVALRYRVTVLGTVPALPALGTFRGSEPTITYDTAVPDFTDTGERAKKSFKSMAMDAASAFGSLAVDVQSVLSSKFVTTMKGVFGKISSGFSSVFNGFKSASSFMTGIYDTFKRISNMTAESVTSQVQQVVTTFTAVADNLPMIIDSFAKAIPPAIPKIAGALSSVFSYLATDGIDTMIDLALSLVDGIIKSLPSIIPQLIMAGAQLIEGVIGAIPQLIAALIQALPIIVEGIVRGLVAVVVDLMAKLLDALGLDRAAQKLSTLSQSIAGVTSQSGTLSPTPSRSSAYSSTQTSGYRADITSTDSYIPGGSSKTIKTTDGDAAMVYQSGGENDPARVARSHTPLFVTMIQELREIKHAIKEQKTRNMNTIGTYRPAERKK